MVPIFSKIKAQHFTVLLDIDLNADGFPRLFFGFQNFEVTSYTTIYMNQFSYRVLR